ncbi:MAG: hypothetical protein ACRBFS_19650 [Aureispira sp.]
MIKLTAKQIQESGVRHLVTTVRHDVKAYLGSVVRNNSKRVATIGYIEGKGYVLLFDHRPTQVLDKSSTSNWTRLNFPDRSDKVVLEFSQQDSLYPLFKDYLSKQVPNFYSDK